MGCTGSTQIEYVEILDQCTAPDVVFHEEIVTINGGQRNTVTWLPETLPVKAVVLISHGLNEHSLRYYGIAVALAKAGFAVHAIDHVSHGKSEGKRGIIADHTVLYNDFIAFGKTVRDQYPTLPLFLLAHSMGTLVAMKAINGIEGLRAVVLSGAAVFSGPAASSPFGIRCLYPLSQTSVAVCLTSITSVLDPGGSAAPLVIDELSSDPVELERNRKDPRVAPAMVTNKSAYELVKLIAEVKEEIPNIMVPFLCIHGAEDKVALPKSSDYIYSNAGTDIEDRQLYVIPGAKHEPFHETEAIRIGAIQYVVEYFEAQYRCTGEVVNPQGKRLVTVAPSASENETEEVMLGASETTAEATEKSVEMTTIASAAPVATSAVTAAAVTASAEGASSETDTAIPTEGPATTVAADSEVKTEAESEPIKEVISTEDVGVAV